MKVDPTIERLFKEVAEETGVPVEVVSDCIQYCMRFFTEAMKAVEVPKIIITRFGTFKPSHMKLKKRIEFLTSQQLPEKGSPEALVRETRINQFKEVLARSNKEYYSSRIKPEKKKQK